MPSIFYLDYENGNDSTTGTPLGWWSLAITSGTGGAPIADEACSGATAHGHLTVYVHTSGSWAGNDEAGTLYFYGKTGTFGAETVSWAAGSGTAAGDAVYCAWKTITSGATAARIAPGDEIRIAKSGGAPTSIGNATWTNQSRTLTLATKQNDTIDNCETAWTANTTGIKTINATPTAGGSGYTAGDILTVTTGGTGGKVVVKTVDGSGVVTALEAMTHADARGGTGYGTGTGKATSGGTGDGNCTVNITALTAANAVTRTSASSSVAKQGSYCMKVTSDALAPATKVAYFATGTLDMSSYQRISLMMLNYGTITGTQYKICLCSDTAGETIVDEFLMTAQQGNSYGYMGPAVYTKEGGGNLSNDVKSIALYSGASGCTSTWFYFDNIVGATTSGLSHASLISKSSSEQGGDHDWYTIKNIVTTTVIFDNGGYAGPTVGRGYYGTGEVTTCYIRETTNVSSTGAAIMQPQDNGTSGNLIEYQGGYNTATNEQDGETIYDARHCYGDMFYLSQRSYLKLNHLSAVRAQYGFYLATNCHDNVFDNILCSIGNSNSGFGNDSTSYDNTIGTVVSFSNNYSYGLVTGARLNVTLIKNANNNLTSSGHGIYANGHNVTIGTVTNACNNGVTGINSSSSSYLYIGEVTNAKYNGNRGITMAGSYGYIGATTITNNTIYGLDISGYNNTVGSLTIDSTEDIFFDSPYDGAILKTSLNSGSLTLTTPTNQNLSSQSLAFLDYDGTAGDDRVYYVGGYTQRQTTTRDGASGSAINVYVTTTYRLSTSPLSITLAKVACAAGSQVTFTVKCKKSHATDIAAKIRIKAGILEGVTEQTDTKADDTDWETLQIQFTPSISGVVEIEGLVWYVANTADEYVTFDTVTVSQA